MSEVGNFGGRRGDIRKILLMTVSALALSASSLSAAEDGDDSHPVLWIELGGQFEAVTDPQEPYAPVFTSVAVAHGYQSPTVIQRSSRYNYGAESAISFTPEDSDWEFSASVRIGRSRTAGRYHRQTPAPKTPNPFCAHTQYCQPYFTLNKSFATENNTSKFQQNMTVVDFQAGRDVGLGVPSKSRSTVSLGVRYAQFGTSSSLNDNAMPYPHWGKLYISAIHASFPVGIVNQYYVTGEVTRSFIGVGPSLSWKSSLPLTESHARTAQLMLDWQADGAVLFGRQKASGHFHTKDVFRDLKYTGTHYSNGSIHRAHAVVVPNVGGQAALTLNFSSAKVSLGYRGDFFFGAMDGGVDKRKSETVGFYGPFATISIGMGG
ncbi:MAG TPA: hypothetical protein VK779_04220 [Rhizomicrobium sp.]|jgi:hypothetical protein|nr:hypothetical protein [Rhizomicrobium sp.]